MRSRCASALRPRVHLVNRYRSDLEQLLCYQYFIGIWLCVQRATCVLRGGALPPADARSARHARLVRIPCLPCRAFSLLETACLLSALHSPSLSLRSLDNFMLHAYSNGSCAYTWILVVPSIFSNSTVEYSTCKLTC